MEKQKSLVPRLEEENHRMLLKMRDMRDELLWYKVSRIPRSESAVLILQ